MKNKLKIFKKECLKWQKLLGLSDYKLKITTEVLESNAAECRTNENSMIAQIVINKNKTGLNFSPRECALHEMLELLLCKYDFLAGLRFNLNENDLLTERHAIIQRLSNLLESTEYGKTSK